MSEWKEYKLGDVINLKRGYDLPSQVRKSGSIPIFSSSGITDFHIEPMAKGPGVITGRYGTVGQVFYSEGDYWPLNTTLYVQDFKGNSPKFIYYFLKAFDFEKYSDKSAVPGINRNDVHTEEVYIPRIDEQKSIASVLSSLDDKIDLLHRQNKTLESLAETLFRQWFVEEAEKGWEEKQLSELMTITSSKRIFYSEYVSYGIPFYRSKEIIELRNSGSTNSELFIPTARFNEIKENFGAPMRGDILLTSVGTLGVPFRVRGNDEFYFKDGNLTWFKDFKGISSSIIYFWLLSRIGQEQITSITIGSTQEAITIDGLKGLKLKLPPKDLLQKYEVEFESIHFKIESNQKQIHTLTEMRDTLLPKLMNGEVRVTEP